MKKYRVITKVGDDDFKKWKVNNLLKFVAFLNSKHPDWRWFNVYQYQKDGNGKQLANYTKKNLPRSAFVSV